MKAVAELFHNISQDAPQTRR